MLQKVRVVGWGGPRSLGTHPALKVFLQLCPAERPLLQRLRAAAGRAVASGILFYWGFRM